MAKTTKTSVIGIGVMLFVYVVLLQRPSVNCQVGKASVSISDMLPFCIGVPGILRTSQVIKITGSISRSSAGRVMPAPWLNLILSTDCARTKIPFYLRMQVGKVMTVVGNTFENGYWGEEISGRNFTFPPTGQFVFLVAIQSDGYKVTGNGVPLWTLPHRFSYTDVTTVAVRGASADIQKIELIDDADPDQQRNTQIMYPVPLEQPLSNPTFPFWGYIPGGLQLGKAIRIKGNFPTNVPDRTRTSIDLCKDRINGPIMLHIDIRFKSHGYTQRVIRNSYQDGRWSPTEDSNGPFPFKIGEQFTMLIQVQPGHYNISVNGVPCWTYSHRLPYTEVTQLVIGRSTMDILEVAYIDPPEKPATSKPLLDNVATGAAAHASQAYNAGICMALFVLGNHFLQVM